MKVIVSLLLIFVPIFKDHQILAETKSSRYYIDEIEVIGGNVKMKKKYYDKVQGIDDGTVRNIKWWLYCGSFPYSKYHLCSVPKRISQDTVIDLADLDILLVNKNVRGQLSSLVFDVVFLVNDSIRISALADFVPYRELEYILSYKRGHIVLDRNQNIVGTSNGTLAEFESLIFKNRPSTKVAIQEIYKPWLRPAFREYIANNQSKLHRWFRLEAMRRGYLRKDYFYYAQEIIPWLERSNSIN